MQKIYKTYANMQTVLIKYVKNMHEIIQIIRKYARNMLKYA